MKKLVIILVVVGVSFLALLVYGVGRSEQSGHTDRDCSSPPKGDDLDEDDFEDWCPPKFAEATRPLQDRFAPDLGIQPVQIENAGLAGGVYRVASSDKRGRSARITLVNGNSAILRGISAGEGNDSKLCLCRPSTRLPDEFDTGNCPKRWIARHFDPREKWPPGECRPGDEKGGLPFLKDGGTIVLQAGPEARVRIE